MKKVIISFILIFVISIFFTTHALAVNMFLEDEKDETMQTEEITDDSVQTIGATTSRNNSDQYVITSSTTSTSDSKELTATDIINIILISVGVVLILLAVAILIRM